VEKFCGDGQHTDETIVHTHCMLDTLGYKQQKIINNIAFHCNNGCSNAPKRYVIRTLSVRPMLCTFPSISTVQM